MPKFPFSVGRLVATQAVYSLYKDDPQFSSFCFSSLRRHVKGDWGDVCAEDAQANNDALQNGLRILSRYDYTPDVSIYIITEADHSVTTILFPDEY